MFETAQFTFAICNTIVLVSKSRSLHEPLLGSYKRLKKNNALNHFCRMYVFFYFKKPISSC